MVDPAALHQRVAGTTRISSLKTLMSLSELWSAISDALAESKSAPGLPHLTHGKLSASRWPTTARLWVGLTKFVLRRFIAAERRAIVHGRPWDYRRCRRYGSFSCRRDARRRAEHRRRRGGHGAGLAQASRLVRYAGGKKRRKKKCEESADSWAASSGELAGSAEKLNWRSVNFKLATLSFV